MTESKTKVCLITGGSDGIGLATAKRFFEHGYHVVICGRRAEKLQAAAEEISALSDLNNKVVTINGDLNNSKTRADLLKNSIERFGRIDVLVNNAGAAPLGSFESIDEATFDRVLQTNIRSVFLLTQKVWAEMLTRGGGTIVNISSMAAVDPFPGFSIYGASKAWLELMTLALAAEGKDSNIRVCAVRPGAVETDLLRSLFPDFPPEQCVAPAEIAERVWQCIADPENSPSGQAFTVAKS
jgi:NAD(P)-dependent dehydrogenase (short-subunit alcohol dehydrogenase family)